MGDDLGLDGDAGYAGLDERWDQVVRVRYLKVGVYGEVDRGGERGRDGGAHGQVGDEVVVHNVEVHELSAPSLGPPHLFSQFGEIGREYGRGADHPVTEASEERQD